MILYIAYFVKNNIIQIQIWYIKNNNYDKTIYKFI